MNLDRHYTVYIMASGRNGTLYVGVTGNLAKRAWQHREGTADGFTKRYVVKHLVWYEHFGEVEEAIRFEKRLKRWRREWKIRRIEERNPQWLDLYETLNC